MLPDLAGLVHALEESDVRFVVIGAVAVAAHGHIRATQALDIVPDPDRANLDRLGNALVSLDARLASDLSRIIDPELRQALYMGKTLTLSTSLGDLDVVQRLPGVPTWPGLARDAQPAMLGDANLLVCSREHLIEMKRARNSLQDQADVEALKLPG